MDIFSIKSRIKELEERADEIAYELIEADGDRADELQAELEEVENELDVEQTNLEDFQSYTTSQERA